MCVCVWVWVSVCVYVCLVLTQLKRTPTFFKCTFISHLSSSLGSIMSVVSAGLIGPHTLGSLQSTERNTASRVVSSLSWMPRT